MVPVASPPLLKLSTFLEIKDGIAHAVHEFALKGDDFHPTLQFELGRRYHIDDWIDPVFRKLMKLPLASLDMHHMDQIGSAGFFWLVQAQAKINNHRKQFAFDTPTIINHPDCDTPGDYVHMTCVDLLNLLKGTEIEGLCEPCRIRTVTWVWRTGHVTQKEIFVDDAVTAFMALQTDEPIRAALRNFVST
ncbi:hypothetical protein B0H17DRAFT_1200387 [Mycena rosella]|uniref:Uncharacterized protein n=1 Tax=Mycena rosella TaxID=1033263 RepID=A0AAD7DJ30_MYCRO|nr:hypothetical protein B0H17DRAFT_1200387 [Mycena rosella]